MPTEGHDFLAANVAIKINDLLGGWLKRVRQQRIRTLKVGAGQNLLSAAEPYIEKLLDPPNISKLSSGRPLTQNRHIVCLLFIFRVPSRQFPNHNFPKTTRYLESLDSILENAYKNENPSDRHT